MDNIGKPRLYFTVENIYLFIYLGFFYGIHQGEQIRSYECTLFTIASFYKAMNPNLMMKFWQTFCRRLS